MGSSNDHHLLQSHQLSDSNRNGIAVVMVPFPAQGHLNQLLQLSCLISSSYGLPVHYVGSAIHNRQARLRANGLSPSQIAKIHFHDLPTPEFDSPPPDPNASVKFPVQLQPSWFASVHLRHPVAALLQQMSSKARRVVIVHDPSMSMVVQDAVSIANAECYAFNCISVFTLLIMVVEGLGKPFPFQESAKGLPSIEGVTTDEGWRFAAAQYEYMRIREGDLHNTSRVIEGPFLDLLSSQEPSLNKRQWAIGPILPLKLGNHDGLSRKHECLEWLNKQAPKSVLYMSFGTTVSLSDKQVRELAEGLEQSRHKFLWVLRDADKGDIFDGDDRRVELPEGLEERVEGIGLVIRDWAPQREILAHSSIGAFMSHCGWNSCIESISMGVPIACWPMHSDQPRNSFLVTEMLKTGLLIREWEKRNELVSSSTIKDIVRRLMASEEGNKIRKRAGEVGNAVRHSAEEGGVSRMELQSFISHVMR
ncbi:PREDICTED: zeatin O-glucosyltransferase-like [Ipomoea nil]|uniref:zeatin O-glucosyltransferase-like n=1 Tax=Ipomoea nil TaxID=35883 RepID=UPI000901AE16|nr:PREDICTED: zeatin O-glucosyltransferase-like [Ipomoea nil]